MSSRFVQVTCAPAGTVTIAGVNVKLSILTSAVADPACTVPRPPMDAICRVSGMARPTNANTKAAMQTTPETRTIDLLRGNLAHSAQAGINHGQRVLSVNLFYVCHSQ